MGSIKNKGNGTYLLTVSLGYKQQIDGKLKQERAYKTVKCSSKKEAQKELIRFTIEVGDGNNVLEKNNIKFGEFAIVFAEEHRKRVSDVTWHYYDLMLKQRIIPCFGEQILAKITSAEIMNFLRSLGENGSRRQDSEKPLSNSTILKYYKTLKLMFKKAVQRGYISKSPCGDITIDMLPKSDVKHNPILTEEELKKLLNVIESQKETRDFLQNKLFFYLCLCTGLRRSEAGALQWKDINLEKKELKVEKALKTIDGKTVGVGEPKTKASNRMLFFDDQLKELFLKHKMRQNEWLCQNGLTNKKDLIFTSSLISDDKDTTFFNPSSCKSWLQKLCRKNGIPKIGMHSLRAMCATLAASSGMPINLVSANLGHTNLTTTSIYVRDMIEMRREASNAYLCQLNTLKNSK